MKRIFVCLAFGLSTAALGQKTVTKEQMNAVYEEVKTPFKYGLVVVPEDSTKKIDCPSVFRRGGKWYMTYVVFNGRGYETWLSRSEDLLHWEVSGKLMELPAAADSGRWDHHQRAGYIALQDPEWGGSYKLKKHKGKYWMSYFGGSTAGYEAGVLSIGMAYTKRDPAKAHTWKLQPGPVLRPTDNTVRWWENKKLFKSTVIEDAEKRTGYRYLMYYNANGDTSNNTPKWRWFERIGMAASNDMENWTRFGTDPVMHHRTGITGDAVLQKMGDLWVMFYFGAFWEGRKDAFNRFACSYDLVNWTDWDGADLIRSSESYDARFAHKSYVIKHNGIVYHFYCAVNAKDRRGIAVATSKDVGKSTIQFK